jgi:hypothetical protein
VITGKEIQPRNDMITPQYAVLISVIIIVIVRMQKNDYIYDLWVYESRLNRMHMTFDVSVHSSHFKAVEPVKSRALLNFQIVLAQLISLGNLFSKPFTEYEHTLFCTFMRHCIDT